VIPEHIELSRRLVACKHFRWMPGMAFFEDNGLQWRVQSEMHAEYIYNDRRLDLSDPASVGCLMQLVREAWRQEGITTSYGEGYWRVHSPIMKLGFPYMDNDYNTEAAALVAALEAAP